MIRSYRGKSPRIDDYSWIADNAAIVGDVEIGPRSNIWFNVAIRADVNYVRIGECSNIQDGAVVHVNGVPSHPTIVENHVTVGHMAMLHGCTLKSECLIGIGAVVLNGAVVESHSIVAAGAVVKEGQHVPSGMMVAGVPAKVIRPVSDLEKRSFKRQTEHYWNDLASEYKNTSS